MSIPAISTLFFNEQSRADLARLQKQMIDMQGQISSGHQAGDLQGYGASAARILSARNLIDQTNAHAQAASELGARFDTVDTSLNTTADAAEDLRLAVISAIANDDGRFLGDSLQRDFDSARTALNMTYGGEALFAGERVGASPINVTTLDQLAAAAATTDIFDEASRAKTIDLGDGNFGVADKASDVSIGLFDAMRTIKQMIDTAGGTLPKPLTPTQKAALQTLVDTLGAARSTIVTAQGRNGQLQKTVEASATRLSDQADTLSKAVSDVADANLAEVATKLNAVQVQYQAVAQTYAQIAHLSLLDYLK